MSARKPCRSTPRETDLVAAAAGHSGAVSDFRVWIDQDLCTGDGLCVDHCPEAFLILEDGISYVHDGQWIGNDPGQWESTITVPGELAGIQSGVVAAAEDCPGECIFIDPV